MEFTQPEWLYLLILVPVVAGYKVYQALRRPAGMQYTDISPANDTPKTFWTWMVWSPAVLRTTVLILCIFALARPQEANTTKSQIAEGVDIMLVLDTSSSMRAEDFKPNRFVAAQKVADEFVETRISDRVGLVVFSAQAFTQVPLTLDYDFMRRLLDEVHIGMIAQDGTAIGSALATAVNRLKDSNAESKVVILLTDGQNNRGEIDPLTASDVAATLGVRVYTIGVGKNGTAPYPRNDPFRGRVQVQIPVEIDEEMLTEVANKTGGKYFRATSNDALKTIYEEIGELEKTEVQELIYTDYEERFTFFMWPALGLLMLEILLTSTRLRRFP